MPKQQQMQMPGVFGGLMRYDEEYQSRFMMSPYSVIVFVVLVIILVLALKFFFPANLGTVPVPSGNVPLPSHGLILSLLG